MAASKKEDGLANLFELQDKEKLLEIVFYDTGGTMYQGKENVALSILNKLRLEGEAGFCDVILEVEGRQLTTHRCILAANSQFFYTMFSSGMKDSNQKVLSLQSVSFTSMSLILDYFYTREIVINDENVLDLLNASSFLLVTPVKNACSEHLSKGLGSDNCFSVLQIAEQFGADELAKRANAYIRTNFFLVVRNEEFVSISQKDLVRFISSDDIQVEKEEEIYQCVLRWVKHDEPNRLPVLPELLKHLRKDSLPEGFLEHEMEIEPLLMVMRSDGDTAPKKTRKRKGGKMKKGKDVKSVQELRPSTEMHNVMIGVKRRCPRKVLFYDLDNKNSILVNIASTLDFLIQIVLVGQTLYVEGGIFLTYRYMKLIAFCFDDFKSACSSAVKKRPLEFETKAFFGESDRVGASLVNLNGLLYRIGGFHKTLGGCQDTVECYNPEMDEWSLCTPMNMRRYTFGCVASDQNIYVISGTTEITGSSELLLSSVEKYDPERNCWSYVAPLKEARSLAGCVYWGEKIYVIGGKSFDKVTLSSCEVYSSLTDEWQTIARLPYPFNSVDDEVIILENQITVRFNLDKDVDLPCEALQYDVQSNRWLNVETLGPSDNKWSFTLCNTKLPVFILERIAREFSQEDWDSSYAESSNSDSESD